jgi:hypothetical protein
MKRKNKKRIRKSLAKRNKTFEKSRLEKSWRNIFVKNGVLENDN